jgi:hypothetical protein
MNMPASSDRISRTWIREAIGGILLDGAQHLLVETAGFGRSLDQPVAGLERGNLRYPAGNLSVLHELDEGRFLGRLLEKVEELFADLADLSPGPADMGRGRLFRIRRTTWLTLEDSQSFIEALDGVILDADALRQIVDLLVPVLVLFFQGQ